MRKLYEYKARVTDVYDGDTITVNIDLGFFITIREVKLRLYGIDTPEVRGDSREDGLVARDYLRTLILDRDVIIETMKDRKGKYGRWLAIVWIQDIDGQEVNVNELLIEKGFAEVYDEQ